MIYWEIFLTSTLAENITKHQWKNVIFNTLKLSDTYDNVKNVFQNGSNAQGIRRSKWNNKFSLGILHAISIVSNASSNRSSKISAKLFDEDILLRAVDISQYNIQTNINTRNIKQYSHQDHVHNGTDEQIFKQFGKKWR